ncbi:MAG TPA: outer membrane beta-barrel protein [Ignavibacteria bacterium]|nr:outer membrane beta-barrel protein [Ignavibacteria bacterium]HRK00666.1 outer membrane beta-barrel protein [Ignavibacteria bacterium]
MTIYIKLFITCLFFLYTSDIYSQSISGKVSDFSNSDPLIGAVVKISGTSIGTLTDYDGTYLLESLSPGNYELEISYIGYTTLKIKNASVAKGENKVINVTLKVDGLTTEEITVESSPTLSNEQSLLTEQKNSSKIQDGISEQQIKRAPDASASDVLKRVIGVNIVDNKYVFIRGTSERYNNTTLNGVEVPSTEADKKSFSFDLFPSKLLENIIIAKSFTPDLPGNFSGGLVQLNTKDFVDQMIINFETGGSYLNGTTSKGNYYSYNAGQEKLLFFNSGIDDGGRSIPSNFPSEKFTGKNNYGKTLRNNWMQENRKAPVNGGFQLSLGNRFNIADNPLGVLFSYTYRNGFENSDIQRNEYNSDTTTLINYKGRSSKYTVLNGGLFNLNYKAGNNNKFSFKNTYSINSEDYTQFYEGQYKVVADYDRKLYGTEFIERSLLSSQISGSHYISNLSSLNINWNASYSESDRNEPDTKTTFYQRELGTEDPFFTPLTTIPSANVGQRFYSKLKDIKRNFGTDFEMKFLKTGKRNFSKIKLGTFAVGTDRNFEARNFAPANAGSFMIGFEPLETIFGEQNIDSTKLYYVEITDKSDKYAAVENLYAGYLMFDIPLDRLRVIAGLRYEYNEQKLNGFIRQTGEPINVNHRNNDYLPSVNLTYSLNDKSNIRISASQTVSRPELREIAPFAFIDFTTEGQLAGNPELEESLIQNYDVRYEMFPDAGEIISLSLFYKHFNQPIEKIIVPTLQIPIPSYTFGNAKEGAVNYGLEIELRKKLGFISRSLNNLTFNANLSLVNSKVNLEGLQTAVSEKERRLQGQSPYTINTGLFYDNYELGISANLLYNRFGDKISEVGRSGFYDVMEKGRDQLDLSISKTFFENFEAKFAVKDLFNQDKIYTQKFIINGNQEVEKEVRRYSSGSSIGFTLSYKY